MKRWWWRRRRRKRRRIESFALEDRSGDLEQVVAPVLELRASLEALFAPYLIGMSVLLGVVLARSLIGVGPLEWTSVLGAFSGFGVLALVALGPLAFASMLAVVWIGDLCAEIGWRNALPLILGRELFWYLEQVTMLGVGLGGTAQVVAGLL